MDHRKTVRKTVRNNARARARQRRREVVAELARRGITRRHPLLMRDHPEACAASLSLDSIRVSLVAPYYACVLFYSTTDRLNSMQDTADGALVGRGILPGDVLIFDTARTAPEDGAVQWVEAAHPAYVARVCRVLPGGAVEFRATVPGIPPLAGPRRVVGTLAAVVRATDGKLSEAQAVAEEATGDLGLFGRGFLAGVAFAAGEEGR